MQPLPAHETRVDFVPVHHARLAELPAVVDVAPIYLPAKIHEPGVHAFDDDTEGVQLGNIAFDFSGETLRFGLKELRDGVGMLGTGADGRELELTDLVFPEPVIAHEVVDDPADQWEGAVGFFDCVTTVTAPCPGTIQELHVLVGQTVESKDLMARLAP